VVYNRDGGHIWGEWFRHCTKMNIAKKYDKNAEKNKRNDPSPSRLLGQPRMPAALPPLATPSHLSRDPAPQLEYETMQKKHAI